jgi:hypothetical protein
MAYSGEELEAPSAARSWKHRQRFVRRSTCPHDTLGKYICMHDEETTNKILVDEEQQNIIA